MPWRRQPIVEVTATGLAIAAGKTTDAFTLDDVVAVDVYKRDLIMIDLICCDVRTVQAGSELVRTLNEDMPGFADAMKAFEALPGFDRGWRAAVVLPPFAENRARVFSRDRPAARGRS